MLAALPWVVDGIAEAESHTLATLGPIAVTDIEAARMLLELPWVADGVTATEHRAIEILAAANERDPEAAELLASLPWVIDGITDDDALGLDALSVVARRNPRNGAPVRESPLAGPDDGQRTAGARLIGDDCRRSPPTWPSLSWSSPWVIDGVTATEQRAQSKYWPPPTSATPKPRSCWHLFPG